MNNQPTNDESNVTPPNAFVPNVATAPVSPAAPIAEVNNSKAAQYKKYFLNILIGGLVVSAIITVIAILIGQFNDIVVKTLLTTFSIVVHSLAALTIVVNSDNYKSKYDDIITNTIFGVTVASFVTMFMTIWSLISSSMAFDLYKVYFDIMLTALVCKAILTTSRDDNNTRVLGNYSVYATIFLAVLFIPLILRSHIGTLSEIYYRGLAATSIVVGTLIVLTAIFHSLYTHKHPELKEHKTESSHFSSYLHGPRSVIIFIVIYLVFSFLYSLLNFATNR